MRRCSGGGGETRDGGGARRRGGRGGEEEPDVLAHGADVFPAAGGDVEALGFAEPGDVPGEEGEGFDEEGVGDGVFGCEGEDGFVDMEGPGAGRGAGRWERRRGGRGFAEEGGDGRDGVGGEGGEDLGVGVCGAGEGDLGGEAEGEIVRC